MRREPGGTSGFGRTTNPCTGPLALLLLLGCASAALSTPPPPVGGSRVAIVVHSNTPVDNLSMADVRKIFLGDRQFWTPKLRVVLLVRAPVAHERAAVLKYIYQMSEAQFRQYWIAKIFRDQTASGPKIVYSAEMTHELVAAIPGAIAFMDAGKVQPGLKVLRVNGKLPGESGYPLQ